MDTLPTTTTVPALAPMRRPALRSHLAGFGITGLIGLAVLTFWLLAALFGPVLLPQGRSGPAAAPCSRRSVRCTGSAPTTSAATCSRV